MQEILNTENLIIVALKEKSFAWIYFFFIYFLND